MPSWVTYGTPQWLQAHQPADCFVRHRNFLAELEGQVVGEEPDYQWVTVDRGRDAHSNFLVALRSVNIRNHYLRHKDFRLVLEKSNGPNDDLWWGDSTFIVVPGLASPDDAPAGMSFLATNLQPDRYIRHRDFHMYVEPNDGSPLFRSDATFYESVRFD